MQRLRARLYFKKIFFHARDAKFIRELIYSPMFVLFRFSFTFLLLLFLPLLLPLFSSIHFSLPFPLPLSLVCYVTWISSEAFSTKKRSHEGRTVRMRFSSLTVILMSITSRLSHRCYVCERESGPRNRIGFSIFRRSLPAYIVHTCKNITYLNIRTNIFY